MNIEKIFKRIIILGFIVQFIIPFTWGIFSGETDVNQDEIIFNNAEILFLIVYGIYLVNLYFLYTLKSIGKTLYVPFICVLYGSMYFFPLEDLIWFSSHSEYFLDVADSMLTGVIISMIYFTDIKKKFS